MDPKRTHQIDQETGPMHELAIKLAAYYRSLQREGLTPAEAMQVVLGYQDAIVVSVEGE